MSSPRTWHQSSLNAVFRCGIAYERRYIKRELPPPTTPRIRGAAVHGAIGVGLLAQRVGGAPTPVDVYEDVAASEVDRARHGGATFTAAEAAAGAARTWGGVKDAAVTFAAAYGTDVAPGLEPVVIEHQVTVEVAALPGVRLRGTLDLETALPDGGRI